MITISNILVSAGLISLVSFAGAILTFQNLNGWFSRNTKLLVTFAAGVFVMTAVGIMGETFELLGNQTAIVSIVGGFLGMLILHKIIPETHHHHDKDCHTCLPQKSGHKLVLGDVVHNTADGIVLVAAFSASLEIGIITSVSILIHEVIQEISEFIVLRNSGYSIKKSLLINFFSSLSIFIGIAIGLFLTQKTELQAILLGISAGIFLHIVFHDLIPYNSVRKLSQKSSWNYIVVFLLGIGVMFGVSLIAPHGHDEVSEEALHIENISQ